MLTWCARCVGPAPSLQTTGNMLMIWVVLFAIGWRVGPDLRGSSLQVRDSRGRFGMVISPKKTVVVTNGLAARSSVTIAGKNRSLSQLVFTTRDLGVDVQWVPWRNPVQKGGGHLPAGDGQAFAIWVWQSPRKPLS